jgi:hypothetical protein
MAEDEDATGLQTPNYIYQYVHRYMCIYPYRNIITAHPGGISQSNCHGYTYGTVAGAAGIDAHANWGADNE